MHKYQYQGSFPQFDHVSLEDSLKTGIYVLRHLDYHPKTTVYVGSAMTIQKKTIRAGFRLRWVRHLTDLKHNRHCNSHLQNVCNKYGLENLRFDILEFCDAITSNKLETEWITKLDSFKNGYNGTEQGGNTSGFKMPQSYLDKVSLKYARYDLEGSLIDVFQGRTIIKDQLGIMFNDSVFQDSNHSAGGFLWRRFKEGEPEQKIAPYINREKQKILCYNKEGDFVREYESLLMASKETNIPVGNLSKALNLKGGQVNSIAYNLIWKFYTENYPLKIEKILPKTGFQKRVRVININTNESKDYLSLNIAERELRINKLTIITKAKTNEIHVTKFKPKISYRFEIIDNKNFLKKEQENNH